MTETVAKTETATKIKPKHVSKTETVAKAESVGTTETIAKIKPKRLSKAESLPATETAARIKPKRLSKSARSHARRVKREARLAGAPRIQVSGLSRPSSAPKKEIQA